MVVLMYDYKTTVLIILECLRPSWLNEFVRTTVLIISIIETTVLIKREAKRPSWLFRTSKRPSWLFWNCDDRFDFSMKNRDCLEVVPMYYVSSDHRPFHEQEFCWTIGWESFLKKFRHFCSALQTPRKMIKWYYRRRTCFPREAVALLSPSLALSEG